jgi:hypothetical protein
VNNTDRKQLERLYKLLKIPRFSGGATQSTSIEGLVTYALDCAHAIPMVQDILYGIGSRDPYRKNADELLDQLEEWFNKRRSENWQHPRHSKSGKNTEAA